MIGSVHHISPGTGRSEQETLGSVTSQERRQGKGSAVRKFLGYVVGGIVILARAANVAFAIIVALLMYSLAVEGDVSFNKHSDRVQLIGENVAAVKEDIGELKLRLAEYGATFGRIAETTEAINDKNALLLDLYGQQLELQRRYLAAMSDGKGGSQKQLDGMKTAMQKLQERIEVELATLKRSAPRRAGPPGYAPGTWAPGREVPHYPTQ